MDIIKTAGLPAFLEQLAEESAELAQASLKLARKKRGENPSRKSEEDCLHDLAEEVADVTFCIDLLLKSGTIDEDMLEEIRHSKAGGWETRLAARDKGQGGKHVT